MPALSSFIVITASLPSSRAGRLDPPVAIRALGRIREHVGDALHEPLGVAVHAQRRMAGHEHAVPAFAEQRVDDLERVADDLGELGGGASARRCGLRDPRHVEQVTDEPAINS
jgi:hypothetical protein